MQKNSPAALSLALALATSLSTFVTAQPVSAQATGICLVETTLSDLQAALRERRTTSKKLVAGYLARIAAYDKRGPKINSILEVNPDALTIAADLDLRARNPRLVRGPLYGIPIVVKDNVDTADRMHTSAGTLALANNIPPVDSFVAKKLREAGAIILGKANMTEYANFQAVGMPAGYSSRGGQVLNPYVLDLDPNGIPIVTPGGSSSGSGAAVAANLAAASIGTETSGSLLSPASANGLVTVKPTVGLISRTGIIPIAASQDTAGPLTRTVRDAAIVLGALTGVDPEDPATSQSVGRAFTDYTIFLDPNGLQGARIGVPRNTTNPSDPNNVYYRNLNAEQTAIMNAAIAKLQELGATIMEATIPTASQVGGAGTTLTVPVTNPFSTLNGSTTQVSTVLLYEFKVGLNAYFQRLGLNAPLRSLTEQIAYNNANPETTLRFAQDLLIASDATSGDLTDPTYTQARQLDIQTARTDGIDAYMSQNQLDAILFPANFGAAIAAKAGYPSVSVPGGYRTSSGQLATPPYPFGITFTARAWSEPTLLKFAYAYEQATQVRRPPSTTPALNGECSVPSP
jgi:amidase